MPPAKGRPNIFWATARRLLLRGEAETKAAADLGRQLGGELGGELGRDRGGQLRTHDGVRTGGRGIVGACALTTLAVVLSCAGASAELRAGKPGAVQEGKATYYAARLAGHLTANGERYDPTAMTAAHPTLPFGTRVRVTRVGREGRDAGQPSGKNPDKTPVANRASERPSVVVRINDRCAGKKKIIDLSEAAARKLGMLRAGIVSVRLEVVSRSPN